MDQRKQDIVRLVAEIGESISRWKEGEHPSLLEVDLVKSRIRELYSNVDRLAERSAEPAGQQQKGRQPETGEQPETSGKPETGGQPETAGRSEPEGQPTSAGRTGEPGDSRPPEPSETSGRSAVEAKPEKTETGEPPAGGTGQPSKAEPEKEPGTEEASKQQATTLADQYLDQKRFMNERFAAEGKREGLGEKIKSKPISSINKSLGINDRFKMINELFNGDRSSFEKTIDILDNAANFNDAFEYLNNSFDWNTEDESVQFLLDLVRRKFIVTQHE